MEEIIKKLIEADKSARQQVAQAKAGRAAAVEEIEATKAKLSEENEYRFAQALENEKAEQKRFLAKAESQIEEKSRETIGALQNLYEEKCGEWVDMIVESVIS